MRVADPELPTFKQVSAVQEEINKRQDVRFRLVVQRTAVDIVGPKEQPNVESPTPKQPINSHTNTQPFNNIKPVDSIRPFKEVPLIDQLPFLDNMQSQKEENNNNLNSTIESEAIKAPELPLDSRTADQTQD